MATVTELSDPYANFMLNPLPPTAASVCSVCLTFTDGWRTCYPCGHQSRFADAVLPISYSVAFGQLHTALQQYKRGRELVARRFQFQLGAVVWRFLEIHEPCLARRVGVDGFPVVTTVPSSSVERDEAHPLRRLLGEVIEPTAHRFRRLLVRSGTPVAERSVDPGKFSPTTDVAGEAVLLIDDTWTTGANVQSAAAALKAAGAGAIGVVVIGRHVNQEFGENAKRLKALPRPFDWIRCDSRSVTAIEWPCGLNRDARGSLRPNTLQPCGGFPCRCTSAASATRRTPCRRCSMSHRTGAPRREKWRSHLAASCWVSGSPSASSTESS